MDFNLFGIPFDINKMFYWLSMQEEAREKKYYVIYQKPVSKTGSVDNFFLFFFERSNIKVKVGAKKTGSVGLPETRIFFFLGPRRVVQIM